MRSSGLSECWNALARRLKGDSKVCVLSDFDGTLLPLVDRPSGARLSAATRRLLRALSRNPRVVLGVISGRALPDLTARVGLRNVWYAGNHGLEIRKPGGEEQRFYTAKGVARIRLARQRMAREVGGIPGVILEEKGPLLAVHYRNVAAPRVRSVQEAFLKVLRADSRLFTMMAGNRVLEIGLRRKRDKGTAVRRILRALPRESFTLYFGDDRSDFDAFRVLGSNGFRVGVGDFAPRSVDHRLRSSGEVIEILRRLERRLRPKASRRKEQP